MDALPADVMADEIFNRLDIKSWVRCKRVCRAWNQTLISRPSPTAMIPWLSDLYLEAPHNDFMDIFKNTIYKAELPEKMAEYLPDAPLGAYKCAGSFGPWLIVVVELLKQDKKRVAGFLYNPLSYHPKSDNEYLLTLPPLHFLRGVSSLVEARMSCLPNKSNLSSSKCMVAAFTFKDIYLYKPNNNNGDNEWKKVFHISKKDPATISDVAFHFGDNDQPLLYFIEYSGKMSCVDLMINEVLSDKWKALSNNQANFKLVVDRSGELLVVGRTESVKGASRITIHKLQQGKLVEKDSLDGGMIFIDAAQCVYNHPKTAPKSDFFVENFVYYLHQRNRKKRGCKYEIQRYPVNQPSSFILPMEHILLTTDTVSWFMPIMC